MLTMIVLGPGFYMLMTGMTLPGMAWMFAGSFGLMAWTYRKPWRLGVISCILPPLVAGLSYVMQLTLFGDAAPQNVVIIAIGIGLLVGYLRARSHTITQDETGSIVAQRTFGYLLIWVIAYGVTQGFGYFSRESLAVRAGLVTGAFSTAMLAMVSIVIWTQYRKAKSLLPVLVFCLMAVFITDNPAHADERTLRKLKSIAGSSMDHGSLPQSIRQSLPPGLTLSSRKGGKMTISSSIHGAQYELIFDSTSRQISPTVLGLMLLESDSATLDSFMQNQMPTNGVQHGNYCNGPSLRFSGDGGTTQEVVIKSNQYLLIVRATTELFPKNRQAKPQTLQNMAQAGCIYFADQLAMTSARSRQSNQTTTTAPDTRSTRPPQQGNTQTPNPLTSSDVNLPSDLTGPPTSDAEKEEIAAVTAAVAAALIAAGIAVNVAQAVAAALAQAIQAGVQLTSEDLQDAIARARTHSRQQTGAREVDGNNAPPNVQTSERITPPRPIYFDDDNPLETNDKGEYFVPDAEGNWAWRSAKEAQRFEDDWRADDARVNARREAEIAAHERVGREDMRRSQQTMHERDERERQRTARTRQTKEELESIRTSASRTEADEILNRATSENVYNPDESLNAEYLRRLKQALHNRLSREAATSDPNFDDNSWRRILGETAAKTLEEAPNSMKIRILSGILTGGTSEAGFQGRQAWNAIKAAAEDAEDRGKTLSRTDALRIVGTKFKDDNLPVNTYNALEAARKAGRKLTWAELGTTLAADGFSLMDAGEAGGKITGVTGGQAVESIARRTLSEETFKKGANAIQNGKLNVNAKVGALGQRIDNAHAKITGAIEGTSLETGIHKVRSGLEKIGLEPKGNSLTAHQANELKSSGKLRPDTEGLIDATRKKPSGLTHSLDEAFEHGRGRGKAKVDQFQNALEELEAARTSGKSSAAEITSLERRVRNRLVEIQGDKHAMNELNALNTGNGHSTIEGFNREMSNLHREVDQKTINRLAEEYGVRPEDVQVINIANAEGAGQAIDPSRPSRPEAGHEAGHASSWREDGRVENSRGARSEPGTIDGPETGRLPEPKPKDPSRTKVGMDRDLTVRVRTQINENVLHNGVEKVVQTRIVYRDVPSTTTARVYNEEFFEEATGNTLPHKRGPDGGGGKTDFKETHLGPREHAGPALGIDDPDKFVRRLDQATTERLHPEAYGTGQADLDAATKDPFRGRDLTDPTGTAKTIEYKVDHWMNETDRLQNMAKQASDPAQAQQLLSQASAHMEEAQRQLFKQYGNMGIKRLGAMQTVLNARGARIPRELAERMNVLGRVFEGNPKLSPAAAEEVLRKMGTNTRDLSRQLSAVVEGYERLRPPPLKSPTIVFQGWQDEFQHENT
jgi:hypothetical protein